MSDLPASNNAQRGTRRPRQERSASRMNKVLEVAERLLEEIGPEKTSIPAIAEAAGVPRAAIYPFFPDKYALFSRLAELHMERLVELMNGSDLAAADSWRTWGARLIEAVASYYNRFPVACILLLRGGFTEDDRHAHAVKNEAMGKLLRERLAGFGDGPVLPAEPDVATLAVEIAFACMKHGYAKDGMISEAICAEAVRAAEAYLSRWESPA